jgi:hypothetical protein
VERSERISGVMSQGLQHDDQAMPDTATLARIDHPTQHVSQARGEHDRIG